MKNTPLFGWLLATGLSIIANFSFGQNESFTQRSVACALSQPWEIALAADGQIWTTEARGYRLAQVNPSDGSAQYLLDANSKKNFSAFVSPAPQGGFTGLALHPQLFAGKPFVYLAYVFQKNGCALSNGNCDFRTKIVRYDYNSATQSLSNEQVLVDSIPGSDDHNGGRLTIGQVGGQSYLFYSVGDMGAGQFANANRPHRAQQTGSYEGKILRFNLEPDGDAGLFDRWLPISNPFNLPAKQSAIWSIGHRNPQGLVFGTNGILYETEHGPYSDDELNIIQAGKNYGFPLIVGSVDGNFNGIKVGTGPTVPIINEQASAAILGANYVNPIKSFFPVSASEAATIYNNQVAGTDPFPNYFLHWPSIAPSGMDFYSSTAIPGWQNSILIASLKRSTIYRLKLSADGQSVVSDTIGYFHGKGRFRDLAISPDGKKIYVACDSIGQTSGPTLGSALVPPNRGCILEFTFQPPPCSPDVQPPIILNCAPSQNLTTSGSTANAFFPNPAAADDCSAVTFSSNFSSGSSFPIGATTVVFTVKDASNNSSTCSFLINVSQNPPPPTTCTGNVLTNPSFEINGLNGWSSAGFSALQTGGANSTANAASLGANGDRVYQTKPAAAGKAFVLKAFAKNLGGAAGGTLAIKFMSATFQPLVSEFATIAATTVFAEFSVSKTAPANTAFVEISIIKETGAGVLVFDELCLTDGAQPNPCSPDATAPTISTCPPNQNLTTSGSSATAFFSNPTASDNCSAVTFSSNFSSGAAFPIGATTVVFTAKDASNNSSTCSFLINVAQNPPPPAACTGSLVQNGNFENGLGGWGFSQGQLSAAFDAGLNSNVLRMPQSGVLQQLLNVEGGSNCVLSGKYRLAGPSLPAPPAAFFDVRLIYYDSNFSNIGFFGSNGFFTLPSPSGAWQNFSTNVPLPTNAKFVSMELFFSAAAANTAFFDDVCFVKSGGSNPCAPDVTAPVLSACPPNQNLTTAGSSAVATFSMPTATDNCSAATVTSTHTSGSAFPIGTTAVVFTARDAANNVSTCGFFVVVSQSQTAICANNLLQNAGFENSFSNWDGTGGSISADAASGSKSLQLCTIGHARRQNLPMTAGKTLTFSFKMKASGAATARVLTFLTFLSSTFQPLLSEFSDIDAGGSFQNYSYSKTAPAGTALVEIGFVKQTSGCILVDDVCLSENGGPVAGPVLQLTLTTPNQNPGQWKNVPLTLTIKNIGTAAAQNVQVNFIQQFDPAVSSLFAYVSHAAAAGTAFNSWFGSWSVGNLAPTESKILTYNGFTRVASSIPIVASSNSSNAPNASANLTLNGSPLLAGDDRVSNSEFGMRNGELAIWPNPSEGIFEIQLEKQLGKRAKCLIMNDLGKIVFSKANFEIEKPTLEIDLSSEPSGLYFLKIECDGRRPLIQKLVVQKAF